MNTPEPLKDEKIEARIPSALKKRFRAACSPAKMATVLCLLVEAYTVGVEAGVSMGGKLVIHGDGSAAK